MESAFFFFRAIRFPALTHRFQFNRSRKAQETLLIGLRPNVHPYGSGQADTDRFDGRIGLNSIF